MSKLTLTTFLTLDGVMQGPGAPEEDQSGSFVHGGWVVPHAGDEMLQFIVSVFARADAFLLGRNTYQIFAGHWPRVTDPADTIAGALNALPKYVASRTLHEVGWNNATLIRDAVGEIATLKGRHARELQVHGSGALARTLIENDLVDEYNLLIFPVVLGSGKRLFAPGAAPAALKLTGARTTGAGVQINTYQRAGRPTYGSFALDD